MQKASETDGILILGDAWYIFVCSNLLGNIGINIT